LINLALVNTANVVFSGGTSAAGSIARVTQLGVDTITNVVGATTVLQFSELTFGALGAAAGAGDMTNGNNIGVLATLTTAFNATAVDNLNAVPGDFTAATKGFIVVGTNGIASSNDIYYYDGTGTNAATTVAAEVASGHAVKIAVIGVVTAVLTAANFADIT